MEDTLVKSLDAADLPQVWIKGMYGFSPWDDGYIGFTEEHTRDAFAEKAKTGDLVVIYGAVSASTEIKLQRRTLGILQIAAKKNDSSSRQSEASKRSRKTAGTEKLWTYAVPVTRAWKIDSPIPISHLAPDTYDPNAGTHIASRGVALSERECNKAFKLRVTEVDVYGVSRNSTNDDPLLPLDFFKPSNGLPPAHGEVSYQKLDGIRFLYMFEMRGDVARVSRIPETSLVNKSVVKIGFSKDPTKRCSQFNNSFPPAAGLLWREEVRSGAVPNEKSAKQLEDKMKEIFEAKFQSLGNEFFLGNKTSMLAEFAHITS